MALAEAPSLAFRRRFLLTIQFLSDEISKTPKGCRLGMPGLRSLGLQTAR
jgi:hypothetical protein